MPAIREWRPISTAPKDGTFVLCFHESGHINVMQFCSDGYWRATVLDRLHKWHPTHWQPLPAPPASLNAENKHA